MNINLIQIILLGVCATIAVYFTYATVNLIVTGQNVITTELGEVTLGFLDYGMIQFYIFIAVIALLLYMLAGSNK